MIPIPQYPIYSSLLAEFDMEEIDYFLDESKNWELNISELERSIVDARKICNPRVLVVINPGNPTGQVFNLI
jgi:alanine transaminase